MKNTSKKISGSNSEVDAKDSNINQLKAEIDAETLKLRSLNSEIEKDLEKFLKPDYKPEGSPANELKEKILQMEDLKEQDLMVAELDSALVKIYSQISDIKSQE